MGSKSKDKLNESSDKVKSEKKKLKHKHRDEAPFESNSLRKSDPSNLFLENDLTGKARKHKREKKKFLAPSYDSDENELSEFTKAPKVNYQESSDDDVFVKKSSEKSNKKSPEKLSTKNHSKKKKTKEEVDIFSSDNEEKELVVDTVDDDPEECVIGHPKPSENVDKITSEDFLEGWPKEDVKELFERIRLAIPKNDSLKYQSRVDKLNWDLIKFKSYSAEECKTKWKVIEKKLRGYRILEELVTDAYSWIEKPWTDFYKSGKNNRHPDMPKRPLTSYMLFYMDKKKKFAKKHPGLEMSKLSKIMAETFNNLSEKKKRKYNEKAAAMREEYNEKMQKFIEEHPVEASKIKKTGPGAKKLQPVISGPAKPLTPLKMFLEDKLKHKGENENPAELIQEYKAKWKKMSNKKKMPWIRWAYEAETKYLEEVKLYKAENPCFEAPPFKSVLSKTEKEILQRMEGKPEKPPNSAYSLFSRIMLKDPELKEKFETPKERMQEIARLWKLVPHVEKEEYNEKVKHLLGNYKLEYANYLDSLPDDKREEELAANIPKKKPKTDTDDKPKRNKKLKQMTLELGRSKMFREQDKGTTPSPEKTSLSPELKPHPLFQKQIDRSPEKNKKEMLTKEELLSREPAQPPSDPFEIFRKEYIEAGMTEKRAAKAWKGMSQSEKNEFEEKLEKAKQQYIVDYRAFLKSLKPEELRLYSTVKGNLAKVNEDEESDDEESGNSDSDSSSSTCKPLTEIGKRKRFTSSSSSEESTD